MLKIYYKISYGIIGTFFMLSNGSYKIFGDLTGVEQSFSFNQS